MEGQLTDDTLTREQAMEVARRRGDNALYQGRRPEEGRRQVQNVNGYPLTALLIAGAIGCGLAYFMLRR